jgi:hypothetical protein
MNVVGEEGSSTSVFSQGRGTQGCGEPEGVPKSQENGLVQEPQEPPLKQTTLFFSTPHFFPIS